MLSKYATKNDLQTWERELLMHVFRSEHKKIFWYGRPEPSDFKGLALKGHVTMERKPAGDKIKGDEYHGMEYSDGWYVSLTKKGKDYLKRF